MGRILSLVLIVWTVAASAATVDSVKEDAARAHEALDRESRGEKAPSKAKVKELADPEPELAPKVEEKPQAKPVEKRVKKDRPDRSAWRNVALGKACKQSSLSSWSTGAEDAKGAVDGKKNGWFGFHTEREAAWWQVDLGSVMPLFELRVFNRMDIQSRADGIGVQLSRDGKSWETVFSHAGKPFGGIDGSPLVVDLRDAQARFLRLKLPRAEYLHLDEVEVYAAP